MKKLHLATALFILFTSCNSKKDEKKQDMSTNAVTSTTEQAVAPAPTESDNMATAPPPAANIPKFDDPVVQKYVDDYTAIANGYIQAYKTKDVSKVQELAVKLSDWGGHRMTEIISRLKPDETAILIDYTNKLNNDMNAVAAGR